MAVGSSGYWVNHSNSRFVVELFDRAPGQFAPALGGNTHDRSGRRTIRESIQGNMLIWLLQRFGPLLERLEPHSAGDSRVFLTTRTALASLTAFLIAVLLGP